MDQVNNKKNALADKNASRVFDAAVAAGAATAVPSAGVDGNFYKDDATALLAGANEEALFPGVNASDFSDGATLGLKLPQGTDLSTAAAAETFGLSVVFRKFVDGDPTGTLLQETAVSNLQSVNAVNPLSHGSVQVKVPLHDFDMIVVNTYLPASLTPVTQADAELNAYS